MSTVIRWLNAFVDVYVRHHLYSLLLIFRAFAVNPIQMIHILPAGLCP